MKAIRVHAFGDPSVLVTEEIPEPEPAKGQVRVRVQAAGVNPVDTYIRSGTYHIKPPLPYTPGGDAAGVIDVVGPGVRDLREGDRVYTAGTLTGSYAEMTLCDSFQVHPLPDGLSFAQGAAVGVPYGAATLGLIQRGRALPGEWVLVHGATGGVGLAAVQIARALGMRIIATGGTQEGRELAAQQGAHHVVDHGSPDAPDQILALTDGKGVDVILEMLANVNLGRDLTLLAQNGRVVIIGSRGTVQINPRDAMQRNAAIYGMLLGKVAPEEARRIHAFIGAGLASGTLRPAIGRKLPLSEAPEAHRQVMELRAYGKIVLEP